MKWSEIQKIAIEKGFVFVKNGKKHDLYKRGDEVLLIERHKSQEVRNGLLQKLRKQLDF